MTSAAGVDPDLATLARIFKPDLNFMLLRITGESLYTRNVKLDLHSKDRHRSDVGDASGENCW